MTRVSKAASFAAAPLATPETPDVPDRPARDEEIWSLANRVQNLHRSLDGLRGLVRRGQGSEAAIVTVRPRLAINPDRAARPSDRAMAPDDPWWPTIAFPDRPLVPPPGYANFGSRTEPAEAVACSVVGLRGRDLEAAVGVVIDEMRRGGGFKPT